MDPRSSRIPAIFASTLSTHRFVAATLVGLLMVSAACQSAPETGSPTPGASGAGPASLATSATPPSIGPAAFGDVPMYRMDPAHQGVQPGPGPAGQPQLIWSAC